MRAKRITARGFRNLADLDLQLPAAGAAVLGPNGHGKTSLIELLAYPVLWRSVRCSADADLVQFGAEAFHFRIDFEAADRPRTVEAGYLKAGRRKRLLVDGEEQRRLGSAIGHWTAVTFLPTDLALIQGPATERRRYLDQLLSLAHPAYLGHLSRYRAALAQRNAALRQGQFALAEAFGPALGRHGAELVRARAEWTAGTAEAFAMECAGLGETAGAHLEYRGRMDLADPDAWAAALRGAWPRDQQLRATSVGPHRDDLLVAVGGRPARDFASTGQQRTAAIGLRLCELTTLAAARGDQPVLLLDDVFAELDDDRQERLAARLTAADQPARQVFVTAPRRDELPDGMPLEIIRVDGGRVAAAGAARGPEGR
jgi:DNA replication and repair protein RecF